MAPFAKVVQVCIYNEFIHKITIVKSRKGERKKERKKKRKKEEKKKSIVDKKRIRIGKLLLK